MPKRIGLKKETVTELPIDPQGVLESVLAKSPRMRKLFNKDNVEVVFADKKRSELNKKFGGGGGLEYWPKEEPGQKDFPHPRGQKKIALEIYDDNLKNDPEKLSRAIYGDLLHGMNADPEYASLREEFKKHYTPQSLEMERRQGRPELNDSRHDEYIRGYLSPDDNREFLNHHERGAPIYSPKQVELLENMKKVLASEPVAMAPQPDFEDAEQPVFEEF